MAVPYVQPGSDEEANVFALIEYYITPTLQHRPANWPTDFASYAIVRDPWRVGRKQKESEKYKALQRLYRLERLVIAALCGKWGFNAGVGSNDVLFKRATLAAKALGMTRMTIGIGGLRMHHTTLDAAKYEELVAISAACPVPPAADMSATPESSRRGKQHLRVVTAA